MLEHLGVSQVVAEAKMMRAGFSGAILIVEGGTDQRFLERFISAETCRILCAHGKENALGAIQRLRPGVAGVLAFVDADFDRIVGSICEHPDVVVSDYHDVEMMLLLSPALDKVLAEYASPKKVAALTAKTRSSIRSVLLQEASRIADIRLANRRMGWGLGFKKIKHSKFVDKTTLCVDRSEAVVHVVSTSRVSGPSPDTVASELPDEEQYAEQLPDYCSGHDTTALLAIGLRRCLGGQSAQVACRENVERWLRLAFEEAHFAVTDVFAAIRLWEEANSTYCVMCARLS